MYPQFFSFNCFLEVAFLFIFHIIRSFLVFPGLYASVLNVFTLYLRKSSLIVCHASSAHISVHQVCDSYEGNVSSLAR